MKPISKTAWYCCGVRMEDAASAHPLINDEYAKKLLGEEGLRYWEEFKDLHRQNASSVARHYIIDNHLKQALRHHPKSTIILIGAGLDSRAYRLAGGSWIELDEPALIDYKNNILPVSACKNQLERIAIDFEKENLADKLSPYIERPDIIFIIEGVLIYLTKVQKDELIKTLTDLFPKHTLFCDLMTKRFFTRLGKEIHTKFAAHGSAFSDITDEPEQPFLRQHYHKTSVISILRTAKDTGLASIPNFVINFLMKKTMMGYSIYSFTHSA